MRRYCVIAGMLLVAVTGCASVHNMPANVPLSAAAALRTDPNAAHGGNTPDDNLLVALSFSGGGMRAAAFSHGALEALDETPVPRRIGGGPLIDRVDFVSGVSGGSIPAAYFGLKKRAALADFREKFLLQNPEEALDTQVNLATLGRGLSGGVNEDRRLSNWLNEHLFHGATFGNLRAVRRPRIWINASDIYNRTPFVFGQTAFNALCSNLNEYPVADAVAASSAVPIAFSPIIIKSYADKCSTPLPPWIERALHNPDAPPMLKSFAQGIERYHDGSMKYVKLLDGGLVDNYGLSGFTIARLSAARPYEPLTPQRAVRIRRALFLLVDAGRAPSGDWASKLEGPSGAELVAAAANTAIDASVRASYTAFQQVTSDWQRQLIGWRCSLPPAARKKLGLKKGWNCRDLKFFVGRVDFGQLGAARAKELNAVKTRFKLPPGQVDLLIAAGRDAVRNNTTYRAFVGSL